MKWEIPRGFRSRKARFTWSGAPYAETVYFGVTLRNGTRLPGRRFVDDPRYGATSRVNLEQVLASEYRISRNFQDSFEVAADALANACQDAIRDNRWPWPRTTLRDDGTIAGSPRDIVDSGRFANSQRGPFLS